jgi:uncharacterized protein YerC
MNATRRAKIAINAALREYAKPKVERDESILRIETLYAQLVARNALTGDAIIVEGSWVAKWLAGKFARGNEHRKRFLYELVSAGNAQFVKTVRTLERPHEPIRGIFGYLRTAINNTFAETVHDTETIAGETLETRVTYIEPTTGKYPEEVQAVSDSVKAVQPKRNSQVYNDIVCGYWSAEETLFCENPGLPVSVVDEHLRRSPGETRNRAKLMEIAETALYDAIRGFGKPDEWKRDVTRSLLFTIWAAIKKDKGIGERESRPSDWTGEGDWFESLADTHVEKSLSTPERANPFCVLTDCDMSDTIDFFCTSMRERRVVNLRRSGFTYDEISEKLGGSVSAIGRLCAAVIENCRDHCRAVDVLSRGPVSGEGLPGEEYRAANVPPSDKRAESRIFEESQALSA